MLALEDLGLCPAKYCAFNWAPLQEFGLAQFLSDASILVHPGAPLERTGYPDLLKIDAARGLAPENSAGTIARTRQYCTMALRVAVFDPASGGMGTLEIPLSPAVTKP
jgi:hypothetical protein